jgi:hypothetical protein
LLFDHPPSLPFFFFPFFLSSLFLLSLLLFLFFGSINIVTQLILSYT